MTSPRLIHAADADIRPLYPVARLIKGAVLEAEQQRMQARELLQQAMAEAKRLVNEATAQAEAVLNEARDQGHEEGFRKFRGLIERAAADVDLFGRKFADEVTRIAFRVAREVLNVEFAVQPHRIVDLVKSAIHHIRSRYPQRIVVHLHPDDYSIVAAATEQFAGALSPETQFSLVQDADLKQRSVLLETEMGHYDFGMETQMAEIAKVLKK
ncbi:MAG: FliH/SctL family protein [Phycisphaeraceae bacterium]